MRNAAPVLTFLLALALPAPDARAELFRCTGPDGKTIFTDQKQSCPGAEPSEPAGVVHRAETPERPENAPAAPSRAPATPDASEALRWKQKKLDAEQAIEQIQERRTWMKSYVGHCNRGGWVRTRDDAGIEQVVNCSVLRREFEALETQESAARDYLAQGLAEECRRAGCLPGWLR